jgi:prevent-host-death family protein
MSKRYSIADARMSLPAIVDQAEAGQPIELTRRGKPVAVIVSVGTFQRLRGDRSRFGDAYRKFRVQHSLPEVGLDDGFAASLRAKDVGRKVSL